MKALMCHNYYRLYGGEDAVFADECWLLQQYGHQVIRYEAHSDQISGMNKLELARKTFWNPVTYREVRELIQAEAPDVVHCANPFPLLSPSLYQAAQDEGVPMVQTLHNFRFACAAATLLRDGRVCEDCVGKSLPLAGIRHRCCQGSLAASTVSTLMHAYHRMRGTWHDSVDQYIVMTEHSKSKFIAAGLPADRLNVKPNFVRPDPGFVPADEKQDYAVFVGRLSQEKGIAVLLEAWRTLSERIPLLIVGDGPLAAVVSAAAENDARIRWVGQQSQHDTMRYIAAAKCLIFPSIWYETFGRSMLEAQAAGTPVIASRMGTMALLIEHLQTGLHFVPGDASDLVRQCTLLFDDEALRKRLASAGRAQFERDFTPQNNIRELLSIYQKAGATITLGDGSPVTLETIEATP